MRKLPFIVAAFAALAALFVLVVHHWDNSSGVTEVSHSGSDYLVRRVPGDVVNVGGTTSAAPAKPVSGKLEVPPEFHEALIRKVSAPGRARRARLEEKARLAPDELELLESKIRSLHGDLQAIEAKTTVALRKVRSPKGEVVVVRLPEPTAGQIGEYHAVSSAIVQSFPRDASPQLARVGRAEVQAALDAYTQFPLPNHVVSLGVDSGFFQAKYARNLSDIEEREQYFAISSDDEAVFQGNIRRDPEMLTRYGYLFGLGPADLERGSAK